MKTTNKILVAFVIALIAMTTITSCKSRPSYVLSKSKMGKVLYDYHICQGLINQLPYNEKYRQQQYIDAVFEKHGITKQDFDTSMVWYNRNASELKDIYEKLNERFEDEEKKLQLQTGNSSMAVIAGAKGDTTEIWRGPRVIALRNQDIINHESFYIKADTSFHNKDKFVWSGNISFISDNKDATERLLSVALTLRYKDGKIISDTRTLRSDNMQKLTITAYENKEIESVSGFLYYDNNGNGRNMVIVDGISLCKVKDQNATQNVLVKDSADNVMNKVNNEPRKKESQPRLTPEQLRRQNKSTEKIDIKKAPDANQIHRRFKRRTTPQNNNRNRNIKK